MGGLGRTNGGTMSDSDIRDMRLTAASTIGGLGYFDLLPEDEAAVRRLCNLAIQAADALEQAAIARNADPCQCNHGESCGPNNCDFAPEAK
jgi:hypothetical protein